MKPQACTFGMTSNYGKFETLNVSCAQTVIDNDKFLIPHICGQPLISHVNRGGLRRSRIQMRAKEQRSLRPWSIWHDFHSWIFETLNVSCAQTVIDNDKFSIPHIHAQPLISHVNLGVVKWSRIQMRAKEQRGRKLAYFWQETFFGGPTLFAHGSAVRPPRDPRFSAVVLPLPKNQIQEAGACKCFGRKMLHSGPPNGLRLLAPDTLLTRS